MNRVSLNSLDSYWVVAVQLGGTLKKESPLVFVLITAQEVECRTSLHANNVESDKKMTSMEEKLVCTSSQIS